MATSEPRKIRLHRGDVLLAAEILAGLNADEFEDPEAAALIRRLNRAQPGDVVVVQL